MGQPLTFRTLAQDGNITSDDSVVGRPRFIVIVSLQEIHPGLNTVAGERQPAVPIAAQLRGLDYAREFAVLVLSEQNRFTGKVTVQDVPRNADAVTIAAVFDVPPMWQARPTVSVSPYHLIAITKEGMGASLLPSLYVMDFPSSSVRRTQSPRVCHRV